MSARGRFLAGIGVLGLLLVATWANVDGVGDILPVALGAIGAVAGAIGAAIGAVIGAFLTFLTWLASLGSGGVGLVLVVANAGLTALAPPVVSLVGITIVTTSVLASVRILQPVVENLTENPFTTVAPGVAIISGFLTSLIATAAGFQSPVSEGVGAANGLLVFGAESLLRKPRPTTVALGILLVALMPGVLIGRILSRRPLSEMGDAIASLPADVGWALAMVGVAGLIAILIGLVTRKQGASHTAT